MSYAPTGPPMPQNYRGYPSAAAAAAAQAQAIQQQAAYAAQAQAQAQAAAAHYRGAPASVASGSGRRALSMMQPSGMPIAQPTGGPAILGPNNVPVSVPVVPSTIPAGGTPAANVAPPGAAAGAAPVPAHLLTSHRTQLTPAEYAARRARKPTSRVMPPGIADAIIGDGVEEYRKLREVERRLDGVMVKKRLDLGDGVAGRGGGGRRDGKVRIWISQQALQDQEQGGEGQDRKRVKVRVEGRVLNEKGRPVEEEDTDESDDEDTEEVASGDQQTSPETQSSDAKKKHATSQPRLKFSRFFKSISVDFEQPQYTQSQGVFADTTPVSWTKPSVLPTSTTSTAPGASQPSQPAAAAAAAADFDSISFTRITNTNLNATLTLERDEIEPEQQRYKLSPELAYILDKREDTRSNIIVGLYEYIRALNLQESEERRSVRCDEPLKRLFGGKEKIYFSMIPEVVAMHTSVPDPVKVPFSIRVDLDNVEDTVYDVAISLPSGYDPITATLTRILANPEYPAHLRAINSLDDQLALVIQALNHSKAKHAFLTGYAEDPAGFVRRWLSSQKRDLSMILGEGENGEGILPLGDGEKNGDIGPVLAEEFRRGGENGVWDTPVAREAVRYMLAKPVRGR